VEHSLGHSGAAGSPANVSHLESGQKVVDVVSQWSGRAIGFDPVEAIKYLGAVAK
jgi:hypothetical protein